MKVKEITETAVPVEPEGTDDLFEMANLYPRETGLPMTVWVSPHGNARQEVRVKVNMMHGNQMNIVNTAVFAIRPMPRIITGSLPPADTQAVFQWITLNADALIEYWEDRIGTIELATALRPISSRTS
jgi:hypothetical protein